MQTTQNYGFKKPDGSNVVNIEDLNDNMDVIDREMNKMATRRTLTLTAAGWSGSYPYTQAVAAAGVTANDSIKIIGVSHPASATPDQVKAANKAAGFLMHNPGGVGAGKITFKAYKKPAVDFVIITEGA